MVRVAVTAQRSSLRREEALAGYLFIMPAMIGMTAFLAIPLVVAAGMSFTDYNLIRFRFVGLANYIMLFHDPLFWHSLMVTAIYSLGSVPLGIVCGLALAVLLNQKIRGLGVFRTIFYLPSVVGGVAASLLWMWILVPVYGILDYLLGLVGIQGPQWLSSTTWVLPGLILMSLWGVGGSMVVYLAGLQGVPTQLYEAAQLDGATPWQQFVRITVPMITPVIFFNLIVGIINSFQTFTQAYIMTGGGPANASLFYVLYLYQNAFEFFKMGYAAAMAWILFFIVFALSLLLFKTSRSWVYYEGEV